MIQMSSVEATIDIDAFSNWLGLTIQSARTSLKLQLSNWITDPNQLIQLREKAKRFQAAFQQDPAFFEACDKQFKEIASIEEKWNGLLNPESELEKESYGEILFFKPILQPLNFVPFFLTIWSALRVYILPGLSLLIPFLTLLAPYFILTFIFHIPITFQNYMAMLQSMVSGNFQAMMNPDAIKEVPSEKGGGIFQSIKQVGLMMITFVQGIIQPYWTYHHLNSIDSIIQEHGNRVLRFRECYQALSNLLKAHGFTFFSCPLPKCSNERDATARILLESTYFKMALRYIGSLEVIMRLTNKKDVFPVHWVKSETPVFRAKDTFDFQVPQKDRKPLSVCLDEKRHALLTGPNKGGKSTVLRALSTSALLAHTYGCSFGHLTLTPFETMFVCLKPDDLPGSKSRFEREIEFTASTLTRQGPIMVFIDELYHSTNPPDALRSCEIYCNQLWKKTKTISVISTHIFDWVEKAPHEIQRLCCPAKIDEKGDIEFQYQLDRGVCKVSSVDTLLKKNGLIVSRA
jgi:hypothetical protein